MTTDKEALTKHRQGIPHGEGPAPHDANYAPMTSRIRYAKSGEFHIAYRTLGNGPIDLVVVPQWFSNVDLERELAPLARFNDRLASFGRVILFDKRGVGLSDPVPSAAFPTIEEWMDDLRAVMDAAGSRRAAVIASMAGGFMAAVFAATYPARTMALVFVDGFPRIVRTDDYPWGMDADGYKGASDVASSLPAPDRVAVGQRHSRP